MIVQFPLLTGQVVLILHCKESRLHDAVRRGLVHPPIVSGRRLWRAPDVLAVAKLLGVDSADVRNACAPAARPDRAFMPCSSTAAPAAAEGGAK